MSVTPSMPSYLEALASLAQWQSQSSDMPVEFTFSVKNGELHGPTFYVSHFAHEISGTELPRGLSSFASLLTRTLEEQIDEGQFPASYTAQFRAASNEPVEIIEVDSSDLAVDADGVVDIAFSEEAMGEDFLSGETFDESAGQSEPAEVAGGTYPTQTISSDAPVRSDALTLRKLLLDAGHGSGFSIAELDAAQQRRGASFPPEVRFYFSLVREGTIVDAHGVKASAASPDTQLSGASPEDAQNMFVVARSDAGEQFALNTAAEKENPAGAIYVASPGAHRVIARSLTEFVAGDFVGETAPQNTAAPATSSKTVVFEDDMVPAPDALAQAESVVVRQLNAPFDVSSLAEAKNLKDLRFTTEAISFENLDSALSLPLRRIVAPLSVWKTLNDAVVLPDTLSVVRFLGINEVPTHEEAELVNSIVGKFDAEPVNITTWSATVNQDSVTVAPAQNTGSTVDTAFPVPEVSEQQARDEREVTQQNQRHVQQLAGSCEDAYTNARAESNPGIGRSTQLPTTSDSTDEELRPRATARRAVTVDQRRGNRNDEGGFVEALKRWFN
ncbi:hypothetical protein ACIP5Z_07500 [Rothia terrae]|uniref:hypothetical protein n=1 Tax=Rothia terrae TaxID=396015 RepID=UPI0037F69588